MNVAVPFLGVSFDVNDLSLLGGLTFLLLLFWLYFSLRREEENVSGLFQSTTDEELHRVYDLLAMTQVLTVPPRGPESPEKSWGGRLLNSIPKLLFLTPLSIQSFVLYFDYRTLRLGELANPGLVHLEFAMGCGIWGIMLAITWKCLRRSAAVYAHWLKAHTRRLVQ